MQQQFSATQGGNTVIINMGNGGGNNSPVWGANGAYLGKTNPNPANSTQVPAGTTLTDGSWMFPPRLLIINSKIIAVDDPGTGVTYDASTNTITGLQLVDGDYIVPIF